MSEPMYLDREGFKRTVKECTGNIGIDDLIDNKILKISTILYSPFDFICYLCSS